MGSARWSALMVLCFFLNTTGQAQARIETSESSLGGTMPYLAPLLAAERAASVPPAAGAPEPAARVDKSAWDRLAVLRAFVGDTDGAISAKDRADGAQRGGQAAALQIGDGVTAQNAIDAIVEQARGRRVVLINENHHVPMHRAFTRKLAAALRKIGYRYLACETFNPADGDMQASTPGYVSERTGTYTRDPVFAGMVNAALADGWQLVPYEYEMMPTPGQSPRQRLEERELGQARELVERIFAKDKNAKVLIHVGNHHLAKSLPGDTALPVMMGEHLRRLTGLDMLHVDQTPFYAHPDAGQEWPPYARLIEKFPSSEPVILRSPDGKPLVIGMQGRVDMQVIFPRYGAHGGRPDWLRSLLGRTPRPVPALLLPKQGRRLIKAFRTDDRPDAVPADIVLVEAGKPAPVLMLPSGQFRFAVENEGG